MSDVLIAVRDSRKSRGRAHLNDGYSSRGYTIPACGVVVRNPELLPWEQTATEDRCKRCAKRAEASRG